MKFKLFAAIAAATAAISIAAPALGRVEDSTRDLLVLVESSGIKVTINDSDRCVLRNGKRVLGSYTHLGMKRVLSLCPGDVVDPIDHATVRHEVWHAVQHCINIGRGTDTDTPVNQDFTKLEEYVSETIPADEIAFIRRNYKPAQWRLEYEATLAEYVLTADELSQVFIQACIVE